MNNMKIYVGCSLTHAPEDFISKIIEFKKALSQNNYDVMEFLGLTEGTPLDVYNQDILQCVGKCDVFIAVCDYPSIGLGYEMAVAVEKLGIPVLGLIHKSTKLTRLVKGILHKNFALREYENEDDMFETALTFIKSSL
jgi:hypothetical protein